MSGHSVPPLIVAALVAATPVSHEAPPPPLTTIPLNGGAYFHLDALPLGFTPGSIVGSASFDESDTRAVFVCSFRGAALYGDPHRMDPVQAFVLDIPRRRLTQLTDDGLVAGVRWSGPDQIDVRDGDAAVRYRLESAAGAVKPAYRFSTDQSLRGDLSVASPATSDRITVYRRTDGRYVLREIGAKRLRVEGVARDGSYALLGAYLGWVDRRADAEGTIDRAGAANALAPRFDDAYGRQLVAIHPLGSAVSQGAYRKGVAYFAFSYGLTRVVAATRDFETFTYPRMPDDPAYSVGDGLGALDDGSLYLAWPEGLRLSVRRGSHFENLAMTFPPGYSDPQPLLHAVASRRDASSAWPALHPDDDALDAALLQWRVYPVAGARWIASYLGHVYLGDAHAVFVAAQPPAFPFSVLTRTDDGTLWGASPLRGDFGEAAAVDGSAAATLWSSHDGVHWRMRYALDGSPGAVGSSGPALWAALTKPWHGSAMIALARLGDDSNPVSFPTGGSYAGEQLFFSTLPSGLYLVWGATPGRSQSDQGILSAFQVDPKTLFAADSAGLSAYVRVRSAGRHDDGGGAQVGDPAMVRSTARELAAWYGRAWPVLSTNVRDSSRSSGGATLRTLDDESLWETEFGARPAPLGVVRAIPAGDDMIVTRAVWLAPLSGHGATERWQRDSSGAWRLAQTLRSWAF